MAEHTLFLGGPEARGIDHAPLLRDLLDLLVDGCQQAKRLYIDGRSTAPGMVPSLRKPQGPDSGLAANFGKWPGTESYEDILRALQEMS